MRYLTLFSLFVALATVGCQNNRSAVMPPPGSPLGVDPYYNRPLGTLGGPAPTISTGSAPVSLSPTPLQNLPPPPTTTSATGGAILRTPRDTYDVSTRVAADGQPIRVIDSPASYNGTLAGVPRGMPLNDGTAARSWQNSLPLPATVATNPFGQRRGAGETRLGSSQGFSGQDGQWRSRSSYEGTERREFYVVAEASSPPRATIRVCGGEDAPATISRHAAITYSHPKEGCRVLVVAHKNVESHHGSRAARIAEAETSIDFAVDAIRCRWQGRPRYALVLGTGLGGLAEHVEAEAVIPYRDIPGFPRSTALAHKGQLVCGTLAGATVVALQGRCHVYEGYCFEELTFATRVVAALGASQLIVSNAAGGINPRYSPGDVMLIDDHVNLMFQQLPIAASDGNLMRDCGDRLGLPPTVRHYYCRQLLDEVLDLARRENIVLQRGVYVGVTGPNYETRAEYRMFRRLGGDAVGMSTIPEVLAAAACGMSVLGFSAITNVARPDAPEQVDAQEVVDVAACAAPKLERLLLGLLSA